MKRHWLKLVVLASCCALTLWVFPFLRYEILTHHYGKEFEEALQPSAAERVDGMRVIRYQKKEAAVYYVEEGRDAAYLCTYEKGAAGAWNLADWECVWSRDGKRDGIVWPYFWQ